jgi:hypothetical protein
MPASTGSSIQRFVDAARARWLVGVRKMPHNPLGRRNAGIAVQQVVRSQPDSKKPGSPLTAGLFIRRSCDQLEKLG